jgi:hypothetical protein
VSTFDIQVGVLVEGCNLNVIRNHGVLRAAGWGGEDSPLLLTVLDGKHWSDGCPGFEFI